jgi:hypothetical protein
MERRFRADSFADGFDWRSPLGISEAALRALPPRGNSRRCEEPSSVSMVTELKEGHDGRQRLSIGEPRLAR